MKKVLLSELQKKLLFEKILLKTPDSFQEYAKMVAEKYNDAPINDPSAHKHYAALNSSNYTLFKRLLSDVEIEFVSEYKSENGKVLNINGKQYTVKYLPHQPYVVASEMVKDVKENGVLKINIDYSDHPYFSLEDNIVFRTVHDYIVHILGRKEFGLKGEIQSYNLHAKLVPDLGKPAIFTEVVGQVCYHSVYNKFPIQKCVILDGFDYDEVGKLTEVKSKNIVTESHSENEDFIDEKGIQIDIETSQKFDYLYEWLKPIFGEKYKDAADSFMVMDRYYLPKYKKTFYGYKHGRTRKYIIIDEDGWPYVQLSIQNPNSKYPDHLKHYDSKTVGLRKISNQRAFNNIYGNLIEWIKDAEAREARGEAVCVDGVCMKPSFFDKHSEIFPLLLKQLKDNGWQVLSINNDPKDIIKNNPDIFNAKD